MCVSVRVFFLPHPPPQGCSSHTADFFFFTVCGDELIKRCGALFVQGVNPPTLVNTAVTSDCLLNALE